MATSWTKQSNPSHFFYSNQIIWPLLFTAKIIMRGMYQTFNEANEFCKSGPSFSVACTLWIFTQNKPEFIVFVLQLHFVVVPIVYKVVVLQTKIRNIVTTQKMFYNNIYHYNYCRATSHVSSWKITFDIRSCAMEGYTHKYAVIDCNQG